MQDTTDPLDHIRSKLAQLQANQQALNVEMQELARAIEALTAIPPTEKKIEEPIDEQLIQVPIVEADAPQIIPPANPEKAPTKFLQPSSPDEPKRMDIERFIGENLSNKIGAFITVLGVAIGIKYAIDNNLIGPVGRILMGYIFAISMYVVSQRLREKYVDLSAVILGAGLCIGYFTTFAAYDFFDLIPQSFSFGIMFGITGLTVWQAIQYDRQVIAISGLVGAYFIPLLLSDGTERPVFFFSYISLVNCGILYLAFRKGWQAMMYTAFVFSWWLMISWYMKGISDQYWDANLVFVFVFFVQFSAIHAAEKIRFRIPHNSLDTVYVLSNALIFAVIGIDQIHEDWFEDSFLLFNVMLHLGLSYLFYKNTEQARPFGLFTRLAIFFFILFFGHLYRDPVLSICWAAQMAVLFWFGRRHGLGAYELSSLPMLLLLIFNLIFYVAQGYWGYDTLSYQAYYEQLIPILNNYSLVMVAFLAAVLAMYFIHENYLKTEELSGEKSIIEKVVPYYSGVLLTLFVIGLYAYFFGEIFHQFTMVEQSLIKQGDKNYAEDISAFKQVWLILYTLIFFAALNLSITRIKVSESIKEIMATFSVAVAILFLTVGLYTLGYLKFRYMSPPEGIFERGLWHLVLRYVAYVFLMFLYWTLYRLIKRSQGQMGEFGANFDLLLHGTALWVVSSELVHWLEMYGYGERSYKVALSILFGCWALTLIMLGMRQARAVLRYAGIALFTATLIKLFVYDLTHLNTISKTIVMVSLGSLLLTMSYLYHRVKQK